MKLDMAGAILTLQPSAEFVVYNEDYSTLQWHSKDVPIPTLEEIQTVINAYTPPLSLREQISKLQSQLDSMQSVSKNVI